MKPQQYLEEVLKRESLSEDSDEIKAIRAERAEVEKLLRKNFEESKPTIRYAGSHAKGTMIRDSFDLDVASYFTHDDTKAGETLEEIYGNVKKALETKYLVVPKTSALRLESRDSQKHGVYFHIDVVPGRYIDEKKEDTFLFQSSGEKKRLQTNLQKHVDHVKNSGQMDLIKLAKYWKIRNGLQIRTFVLELLVIEILTNKSAENLDKRLVKFWKKLRDEKDEIKIEDPANPSGNDLSQFFNQSTKSSLASASSTALSLIETDRWEDLFGNLASMSNAQKIAAVESISLQKPSSPKPWCGQ